MSDANDLARNSAAAARRQMYILLVAGTIVAIGFVFFTGRWILRPINRLIRSADEIRQGNLDLVVESESRDEVGHLSEAFNAMAASLREFRRSDQAKLVRIQRATQQAFDSLPDAVAVIDLQGKVEVATEAAGNIFGLRPNTLIFDLPLRWMADLYKDALEGWPCCAAKRMVQHFVSGEERYYRPEAIPILDNERQPTGVILVLQDVTQLRQQEEIKRGVISTVSHQLKTPAHLHSYGDPPVVGREGRSPYREAGRASGRRPTRTVIDCMASSITCWISAESNPGGFRWTFRAVSPHSMVSEVVEPFRRAAQDQGVL